MAPPVVLVNSLAVPMRVTDVTVAGISVYAVVRAALLASGRLEDPDDDLTLLPTERLEVHVCGAGATADVEMSWIEEGR